MKNSIILVLAFLFFVPFAQAQSNQMDSYTIRVDGLGCPFCAYGLEKKFKEFKGIKKVKIEMETGVFTFSYPSESPLSVEKVEKQVELAGYTPVSTKIVRADGSIETGSSETNVIADKSNQKTDSKLAMFVAGNCDMCKARIEKAVSKIDGVIDASWNKETKMLNAKFNSQLTSESAISKAIAEAGHDTKSSKAKDKKYEKLPVCCLYKR